MKRLIGIPLSIAAASAVAMANFTLTFTSSASDTWQLVGASQGMDISTLVGSSTTPGSAAAVIESAWYYNDTTGQWEVAANTFNPAQVGYTLLTATNPYAATWMRVKGNSAATAAVSTTTDGTDISFTVSAGWNLRATSEAIDTTSATQLVKYPFLNDKTNGVLVYTYNVATNAFEVYSPNGFVSTFSGTQFTSINQYEGFWIKVTNPKTYTIAAAAAAVTATLPVTDGIIGDPGSLITAATLADNTINNFSTLLKFGPQTRLASASISAYSGTPASAMSEFNSTMRTASQHVVTTRDDVITAYNSVTDLVQQLSTTGFVSTTTISGPTAKVRSLIDDINSSIYSISGSGKNSDFNLTETNGTAVAAIDGLNANGATTSSTTTSIGLNAYLTYHPSTGAANVTRLDPILLESTKARDKAASLKAYLETLSTSFTDLNSTMKDLNASINEAANGADVNATVTISRPDVNASAEQLKVVTFRTNNITGANQLLISFVPDGGDPSTATVALTLDFNDTSLSGVTGVTLPLADEDNTSIFNAVKNAIETSSFASLVTIGTSTSGMNIQTGEMNVTGVASTGKNFAIGLGRATSAGGLLTAEANQTTVVAYDAAVTGVSQATTLTFDGTFRGGDQIDLNVSQVEDYVSDNWTGGIMDTNVSIILTADKTGSEVATLIAAEINTDTTLHGFGDPANPTDTTGSISVSGNSVTLEANSSFAGTGYTLLLTRNGNSGLTNLATQASTTAANVYTATSDYAELTGSTAKSISSWDANASNFHQAVEGIRFTSLSVDGTVYTDSASRLAWDVEAKTSLTACGSSNRYNLNTWALPTITELITLYDASTNAMSLTWLNALDLTTAPFTITPSTGSNLNKLFFVSKDGNVSNTVITASTERRVLSASGMTIREYNTTDTTVHMSTHCVAQQALSTDFDEYYNTNRFGTSNALTNLISTSLSTLTDADKRVTDSALNIEWERKVTVTSSTSPYDTFANAEYYCAILNHGGKTDWRLPTIEELTSLNLFDIEARYNLTQTSTGLNRGTLFLYDFNDSSNYWTSDINTTDNYKVLNPVSDVSYTNMFGTTSPSTGATNTRVICVRNQ